MKSNRTTLARVWCLLFTWAFLSLGSAYAQVIYHSSKINDVEDESSITVLKPDDVQAGDFLFVTITNSRANEIQSVKTPDDGWMLVKKSDAGSNFGLISYYKIAGADEPESYEFSFYSNLEMTLPRKGTFIITISRFTGIDPMNPFQVMADNVADNASSKNVIAPSVTTTLDSTYVLVLFGIEQDDGFDPSDTYLNLLNYEVTKIAKQAADGSDETQVDNIDLSMLLGWFLKDPAGETGTRTAVSSGKAGWWAAQTLALNGAKKIPQGGSYTSADTEQPGDGSAEAPFEFTYGTPIGELSPVFEGGEDPTSYSISTGTVCQLPTGLSLNGTTGIIDGTPLVTIDDCAVTVDASNDYGTTTITLYIDVLPRPLTISGTFTANNKTVDGTVSATFATNELTLENVYDDDDVQLIDLVIEFDDAAVVDVMQPVRITSADLGGAKEMYYTLSLTGAPTTEAMITTTKPPVGGRYVSDDPEQVGEGTSESPYEFTYGTPLGDLSPVFESGDAPTSYVLSTGTACQIPTGLALNETTGIIDGTPLVTIDDCAVTVEATNDFGTTSVTVYIDVLPRPLTISGTFTANNKTVDGTVSATFATNELTLENVYDEDDVQLIDLVIEFDDAAVVDVMQPVRITSADLGGAKEMYYTLSLTGAPTTEAMITTTKPPVGGRYVSDDPEQVGDGTSESPYEFTYGTPLGDLSPVFESGDAPTSYVLSTGTACQIPTGLALNETTGVIDGTPLVTIDDCAVTVEATNDFGTTSVTVYIDVLPRPLTIGGAFTANNKQVDGNRSATFATNELTLLNVYDDDDVQLVDLVILFDDAAVVDVMQPVRITSADLGGAKEMYYTLSLTGAPTTEAMITSTNPPVGGRYVSDDPEQTGEGTEANAFLFTLGQDISNLSPVFSGGGAATAFEISGETACPLPQGLSLNASTGLITGTPTATAELCAVSVIASNEDGSTTITTYMTILEVVLPGGSISGLVFEDNDASGTRQSSEIGYAGVSVRLFSGETLVLTATTDQDGAFSFPDVPVGSYTMNILLPEAYYESIPGPDIGGSYSIDVESEQVLSDYLFGIFQEAGVFGSVFDASTSKLMRLAGLNELPSGITITGVRTEPEASKSSRGFKTAENQVLTSTFTVGVDENGSYEVEQIVPGNYVMTIDVPIPWVVVTTNPVDVALKDKLMTEVNFGIIIEEIIRDESVITGYVSASNAVSLSGKQSSNIPKVMLDSIRVELSGTTTLNETISRFTFTDEEGMYTFIDLPPGNYVVEIKPSSTYSYDWPMHKKYAIILGNEAEAGGKAGEESPIATVNANVDRGVALISILIDTNLDGLGDRRVDLTTDWFLELKGLPSQQVRDLGLEAMAGLAYNPDGSLLNGLMNPSATPGTLERINGTDAQLSFSTGLILEQDESYLLAVQNLRFTGQSQIWPIRDQVFTLDNPVNLSDPFGVLKGRILAAELRPMYGVDFNLELADYGDAPQTHGTNRARVTTQGRVQNRRIHYAMDGPRHLLPLNGEPQLYLGAFVSAEADGVPSAAANSAADDDGLALPDSTAQGGTAEISLTLKGSGLLSAWVDWNQNGVFEDTEAVWEDVAVSADAMGAPQLVGFVVPETALVGTAVMRVRLTTQAGVGPNGLAWNGEVEDYLFVVTQKSGNGGGGGPTSDPKDGTLPGEYRLGLNYPNPFNPSTMIPFELAQTGQVRIDIYDVTGRMMETIVDEVMTAGKHTIAFNAKNYPSGVYVIRMSAGGVVRSGKLTLVK